MLRTLNKLLIRPIIQAALAEDIGMGDLTTDSIFTDETGVAILTAKANGVFGGTLILAETFKTLSDSIEISAHVDEGVVVKHGQKLITISGQIREILSGERVALNFLQRISGIATFTAECVALTGNSKTKIIDTRKTVPGLRAFDKYAVRLGGGYNHRFGLYDSVLIKDNHISGARGITNAIKKVRANIPITCRIEVEAKNITEVAECLANAVDIIMLDNMDQDEMQKSISLVNGQAQVEISGGVTKDSIPELSKLGADFISIGALTHSAPSLDISLLLQ